MHNCHVVDNEDLHNYPFYPYSIRPCLTRNLKSLILYLLYNIHPYVNLPNEFYSTDQSYYPAHRPDKPYELYQGITKLGPVHYYQGYNFSKLDSFTDNNILEKFFSIYNNLSYLGFFRTNPNYTIRITDKLMYYRFLNVFVPYGYDQNKYELDLTTYDSECKIFEYIAVLT